MSIFLSLSSTYLSDEDIQALTYDLCAVLRREIDENAKLAEQPLSSAGTKGDPVTIGTIILTLIGSGGVAVTLINVLKSYIERGQHLKINIKGKNGETIEVSADNLRPEQIEQTAKLINNILSAS